MAKIENTTVYPIKTPPSNDDYFVITDVEDSNATKNCKIGDISGSINIFETQVTVPSANILLIATNMFTLITGVPGKYIVPISILAKLNYGTVAYDFGISDNIWLTTSNAGSNGCASILGSTLNNSADNTTIGTGKGLANGGFVAGESLVLWGAGGFSNPTQGDGTLTLSIQYRLVQII